VFAITTDFPYSPNICLQGLEPAEGPSLQDSTLMAGSIPLPTNIRLEWKWMAVANTLAYYYTVTITAVKSFVVQAFWIIKLFMALINYVPW
jgi:hypothetical protein